MVKIVEAEVIYRVKVRARVSDNTELEDPEFKHALEHLADERLERGEADVEVFLHAKEDEQEPMTMTLGPALIMRPA